MRKNCSTSVNKYTAERRDSNAPDALQRHCKFDGIVKHDSVDSKGRKNTLLFIFEGNVYRLIAHSKLSAAEKFEKWVFDEVIPSIQ
jgi:Prophage antirepressor